MPDEQFLGEIAYVSYNYAPKGWLPASGQLLPINQYQALFSLLGTSYGGDGRTNFALPNLNARSAVGTGQGPGLDSINLGQVGGQPSITLTKAQMPAHTHVVQASSKNATSDSPANAVPAQSEITASASLYKSFGVADGSSMSPAGVTTAGGSQPFSIRSPYLGLQACIAVTGIYPSQN